MSRFARIPNAGMLFHVVEALANRWYERGTAADVAVQSQLRPARLTVLRLGVEGIERILEAFHSTLGGLRGFSQTTMSLCARFARGIITMLPLGVDRTNGRSSLASSPFQI